MFITSEKFVNTTNTPKYYAAVFGVLAMVLLSFFVKPIITKKNIAYSLLGMYGVCFLQACYGIIQYLAWLPANHSQFAVTGSFDNPAGFAAVLAMGVPIGLYLFATNTSIKRHIVCVILLSIVLAIVLSGSRSGILAVVVSGFIFWWFNAYSALQIKYFKYRRLAVITVAITFIIGFLALYNYKKDSANGRLLIWRISLNMIKDKPVFGHGYGAFTAKYMDYQAQYFKNSPNSKYAQLADNVKHPFNEFIKIAVEFGFIGLTIVFLGITLLFIKAIKAKKTYSQLVICGLVSFVVLVSFSYPLQYSAVWLWLIFYLIILLPYNFNVLKSSTLLKISKTIIVVVVLILLFGLYRQLQAEMQWKTIAINSLKGKTEAMLPEYKKLYPVLKTNPFFLYNYGAELNVAKQYNKSNQILTQCTQKFNDYDLQLIMADNYRQQGYTKQAIQTFQYASNMIPCRFLPLYNLLEIYKQQNNKQDALAIAKQIILKPIKISSYTVTYIKSEAKTYLIQNQ